jgi:sirohydrochlorin cobaltochelatase
VNLRYTPGWKVGQDDPKPESCPELKSLPRKSLYRAGDEAEWEGEPEIGRARRPAVLSEQAAMVKLPVHRYEDTETLKVEESWVQALSPKEGSRLFVFRAGFLFSPLGEKGGILRQKMRINTIIKGLVLLVLIVLLLPSYSLCGYGDKRPVRKGILLVAFGSTIPEAQVSFGNIERAVQESFPGVEVHWSYTSRIIIEKMARKGKHLATPEEVLAKMMREDFTHVAVQSLHTTPGEEFHGMVSNVHKFAGMSKGLKQVIVGYPLMATSEDVQRVAEAMLNIIPKERRKNDAVVFMGHGTHHPANVYYAALNYHVQKLDSNIIVGTVAGWPEIGDIKNDLKQRRVKKAFLVPFMSVAGDHARNDMAGPDEDSWKSILEKEGIKCVPVLKGTAEYQEFVEIWMDHLRSAFSHFE